jgi:glutamine---fructose-6-phosphate transaminase (isomerizing)
MLGTVSVVHNGIIENWSELKRGLIERGHTFGSDTDTEVVAHLVEEMASLPLAEAVRRVMTMAEGAMALGVLRSDDPTLLVGARRGSPLVVGLGDGENYLASDIPAFLEHTREMLIIDDDRVVEVRAEGVTVTDLDGTVVTPRRRTIEWDLEAAEKGGYPTFMLKEIHEQPQAITDTLRGRLDAAGAVSDHRAGAARPDPAHGRQGVRPRMRHLVPRSDDGQVRHRAVDSTSGGDRHRF